MDEKEARETVARQASVPHKQIFNQSYYSEAFGYLAGLEAERERIFMMANYACLCESTSCKCLGNLQKKVRTSAATTSSDEGADLIKK